MTTWDTGDLATLTLTVQPSDPTTVATVTVTDPDGATSEPRPSPVPGTDRSQWEARVRLTGPGLWVAVWSVQGVGAGSETHLLAVRPAPGSARTYATTGDLATFTGEAPPSNAPGLLVRATRLIDEIMVGAVWESAEGTDNLPADPEVAAAYRDAVCAQAGAWIEAGLPSLCSSRFFIASSSTLPTVRLR